MNAWLSPPTGGAARIVAALNAHLPRIETERLMLRAPLLTDWPVLEPIWTGDRAVHIGGPMTPQDAYLDFCQCVASWMLRGTGALTITARGEDTPLGLVLIAAEYGDPMLELGWLLTAEAEGKGYATEAARALRDWGFATLDTPAFGSFVEQGNTGSARLAERLCAVLDGTVPGHPDCLFYRHIKGASQ